MKARYWILTIPQNDYTPFKPDRISWIRGQLERGEQSGFLHWQLFATFDSQVRLATVKRIFGERTHAEPTRSTAAESYVFKDDTAVVGTRFELGNKPINRNNPQDWETVRLCAIEGKLEDIPADIFVRYYGNLRKIGCDYQRPTAMDRKVIVFWGATGVGKSHRAWSMAGEDAYPKDPNTKFWDGYRNHGKVVIDEFRGRIDISHVLRWFDKYPVIVEVKGSATVLKAREIYITSNLSPYDWYPDIDQQTRDALMRRLEIYEVTSIDQSFDLINN